MFTKTLKRIVRRRFQAAVIWAMVPLAAFSGQSVSGCLSAKGQFDPNCRCWAAAADSAASNASHPCHCACCGTSHCCCKNKSLACHKTAAHTQSSDNTGVNDSSRCRPVTAYFTTTAVNGLHRTVLVHPSVGCFDQTVGMPAIAVGTDVKYVSQLNTGPPPDNLTVALHRWVI